MGLAESGTYEVASRMQLTPLLWFFPAEATLFRVPAREPSCMLLLKCNALPWPERTLA